LKPLLLLVAFAYDDFSSIPMVQNTSGHTEKKSIILNLKKDRDYKEMVKDTILQKHLNVQASNEPSNKTSNIESNGKVDFEI
jgi:hypothetical protein